MSTPIELAASRSRSVAFFRHLRWGGRRRCPRCRSPHLFPVRRHRFRCARCRYEFGEFTGTYLGRLRIPLEVVAHLLYLFVLGVPAYRVRWYVPISLATVERTFRIFRSALYDRSLEELEALRLSGELELDEAIFGGHRRGKRGWGAHGKHVVFGIYQRNGQVITFPVPDRKWRTLKPLIERHTTTGTGSVYYTDDYQGYVALELRGKHERVTHKRDEYVREGVHMGSRGSGASPRRGSTTTEACRGSISISTSRRWSSASTIVMRTSSPCWPGRLPVRWQIIRYYLPQNRVTDHRIDLTLYRLEDILEGELDPLISALAAADREARLAEVLGGSS